MTSVATPRPAAARTICFTLRVIPLPLRCGPLEVRAKPLLTRAGSSLNIGGHCGGACQRERTGLRLAPAARTAPDQIASRPFETLSVAAAGSAVSLHVGVERGRASQRERARLRLAPAARTGTGPDRITAVRDAQRNLRAGRERRRSTAIDDDVDAGRARGHTLVASAARSDR